MEVLCLVNYAGKRLSLKNFVVCSPAGLALGTDAQGGGGMLTLDHTTIDHIAKHCGLEALGLYVLVARLLPKTVHAGCLAVWLGVDEATILHLQEQLLAEGGAE